MYRLPGHYTLHLPDFLIVVSESLLLGFDLEFIHHD